MILPVKTLDLVDEYMYNKSIVFQVVRKEFYYENIKKYNGHLQAILACTMFMNGVDDVLLLTLQY